MVEITIYVMAIGGALCLGVVAVLAWLGARENRAAWDKLNSYGGGSTRVERARQACWTLFYALDGERRACSQPGPEPNMGVVRALPAGHRAVRNHVSPVGRGSRGRMHSR